MTVALLESVEQRVRAADRADRTARVAAIADELGVPRGLVVHAARTLRSYGRVQFHQTSDMPVDDGLITLPAPDPMAADA